MTDNCKKFHFSDFTFNKYSELIDLAKQNYIFRTHHNFDKAERFIIWRHDVDISMHNAKKMARIEAEKGIQSTYFLLLHSEYYNLMEREITNCVNEIIELGHQIGLHFDSHYYNIKSESELDKYLFMEKRILSEIFQKDINAFSFHNTSEFTMSCRKWEYAGMINTYASYFQEQVGYCSDSHGVWRFRRLSDVLTEGKDERLQILTHPVWWTSEIMSTKERIEKCINGRMKYCHDFYSTNLKLMNRDHIDWE